MLYTSDSIYHVSVAGSPNLSPSPVSPASSNPGKNDQQLLVILSTRITVISKDLKLGQAVKK